MSQVNFCRTPGKLYQVIKKYAAWWVYLCWLPGKNAINVPVNAYLVNVTWGFFYYQVNYSR